MSPLWTYEAAAKAVRETVQTETYHRGPAVNYDHVARWLPGLRPRFICEQAELAGYPLWASAPDEALHP